MSTEPLRKLAKKQILQKIQTSKIASGDIITETQLCNEMNISRTPIREALIELVANGILEKVPRKGYRVVEMDSKQKIDVYIILGTLDALAARLAMEHITEEDIKRMKETIELIDVAIKYENYPSYVELQEKFHNIYISKCNNTLLQKMLEDIKLGVSRYTYYSPDTNKLFELCKSINDEHREIVKFFEKKDADSLEDFLINTHWRTKHFDMI